MTESLVGKPIDTIQGKHEPDPSNCLRCWEQENDEVYRMVKETLGVRHINMVEHGEPEREELGGQ